MTDRKWQKYAVALKELLGLDCSPVGVSCLKEACADAAGAEKSRICRAFLQASKGQTIKISKDNNACFGAAWHLGFHKLQPGSQVMKMVRKFVVEGEKLFCSYEALDQLLSQMEEVPDNAKACFLLCPLEKCQEAPQVVLFVCNAEATCRLLTLLTFSDGLMPKIKIGGPTCRMALMYPLLKGEANISFYDYTARKMCNLEKDKLLVSMPYKRIPQIVASIDKCSAGIAKIEYPLEFRQFLQQRLLKR